MLKTLPCLLATMAAATDGTTEANGMLNVLNWSDDLKMKLSAWNVNEQIGRAEYNWYLRGNLSANYKVAQYQQYELGLCIAITAPEPEVADPADDSSGSGSAAPTTQAVAE